VYSIVGEIVLIGTPGTMRIVRMILIFSEYKIVLREKPIYQNYFANSIFLVSQRYTLYP